MAKSTDLLNRRQVLASGTAAFLMPKAATAQARRSYDLKPIPVAQGIWMVEGAPEYFSQENGGAIVNCILMQGQTGLILIDSGPSRRYGEALKAMARRLDLRGVSAVVNTHHHPDHFLGNQVFADKPIFALGDTILLERSHGDGYADNLYRLLGDWMRGTEVMPATQGLNGGSVVIDGRRLDVLPFSGHSEADLALLDHETGTLVGGDLLFLDRAPTTPSADIATWLKSLDSLEALNAAGYLPGHGPIDRTGRSVTQTRDYLLWLSDMLTQAAQQGFDMIEVMEQPLPQEFAMMGAQPQEFQRSVAHLFSAIELQVLPRAN